MELAAHLVDAFCILHIFFCTLCTFSADVVTVYKQMDITFFNAFIVCCLLVVVLVTMGMTLVFQGQTKQHVAANVMTAPKTPTTVAVNGPV